MKNIFSFTGLIAGVLLALSANAQQITKAEYFFDTDPGVGKGLTITIPASADSVYVSGSISVTGLAAGAHSLSIRTRDANKVWSLSEHRIFFVYKPEVVVPTKIVKAEYFFDNDPGQGKATAINTGTTDDSIYVKTSTGVTLLSKGAHRLYVRVMNENKTWSIAEGRTFFIDTPAAVKELKIVKAEYFFDNDPGIGNGIAVSTGSVSDSINVKTSVTVASLSNGVHRLYLRVMNESNEWSLFEGRTFWIENPHESSSDDLKIVSAESFFDSDPGVGNGIEVTPAFTSADSVHIQASISTAGLTSGVHYLYTRVKNQAGNWSLAIKDTLTMSFTGIDKLPVNQLISIYPNPNNGSFEMGYNLSASDALLQVRDVTGRVVYSAVIAGKSGIQSVSIPGLKNGAYFWQIFSVSDNYPSGKIVILK